MGLHKDYDDSQSFSDFAFDNEDEENLSHKRKVRKKLEERLERKRLKEEFDELDGDFNWDEFNN